LNPPDHGLCPGKTAILITVGTMHIMRTLAALSVLIVLSSFSVRADVRAENSLMWISHHLQTVSYTVTTPRATYAEYESAKMEFDGCYVTIVEDIKTQKSDIQTTVSFNPKNIRTDMIRFRSESGFGKTQATPYFLVQLPLISSAINITTFTASGASKSITAASTSVSILFQDRDMANLQASAWRDAALACGAREANRGLTGNSTTSGKS
jgi:hypothetical protein